MGTIEETKVIQAINRLEDAQALLNEVSKKDNRFNEKFAKINSDLENFESQLREIREKLNVENLGIKGMAVREL
ncbi:MAG TPA: hypothetical protein DDW65_11575 [Firmicutes bacterium]|jgi:hypothetical protein|nr:hypothetical protein [Bacillota bacterium]